MSKSLIMTPKWSRPDGKPSRDPRRLCHNASLSQDCPNEAMIPAKHCVTDPVSGKAFYVYVCIGCAETLGWS